MAVNSDAGTGTGGSHDGADRAWYAVPEEDAETAPRQNRPAGQRRPGGQRSSPGRNGGRNSARNSGRTAGMPWGLLAAVGGILVLGAGGYAAVQFIGQMDTSRPQQSAAVSYLTNGAVQVRATPSSEARVVATLREGTRVAGVPAGTVEGVAWIEVTAIDGTRGFVPASDLTVSAPPAAASEVVEGTRRIVTSTLVNLRASPSLASAVVATAEGGTRLVSDGSIASEGETWLRVPLTDDVTGWVLQRFTTADEESASGSDEGFSQTGVAIGVGGKARVPVNVTAMPGSDARVVRSLMQDEGVRILGQTFSEGWYYIVRVSDGSQGFVDKEAIALTEQPGRWEYPDGTPAPGPGIPQGSQPSGDGTGQGGNGAGGDGITIRVAPEAEAQAAAAEAAPAPDTAPPTPAPAPPGE